MANNDQEARKRVRSRSVFLEASERPDGLQVRYPSMLALKKHNAKLAQGSITHSRLVDVKLVPDAPPGNRI